MDGRSDFLIMACTGLIMSKLSTEPYDMGWLLLSGINMFFYLLTDYV